MTHFMEQRSEAVLGKKRRFSWGAGVWKTAHQGNDRDLMMGGIPRCGIGPKKCRHAIIKWLISFLTFSDLFFGDFPGAKKGEVRWASLFSRAREQVAVHCCDVFLLIGIYIQSSNLWMPNFAWLGLLGNKADAVQRVEKAGKPLHH